MEFITTYFMQQGILGVIILMTIGVIIWQQSRLDKKDAQISGLQDARLNDTKNSNTGYTEISKEMVSAVRDNVNTLSVLQNSINSVLTIIQNVMQQK